MSASQFDFTDDAISGDAVTTFDLAPDVNAEADRLQALYRYGVLDTVPEEAYDHVAELAAYLFDAPAAAVSLIDQERHWFKSCIGLSGGELSLENSFCARAIQSPGVLVIEDAAEDEAYADMPVVDDPGFRFYAGAPLTTPEGFRLGTLCVLDYEPRPEPSAEKLKHLKNLAQIVVDELELRRETAERKAREQTLRQEGQRAEVARAVAETAKRNAEEDRKKAEEASVSKSRFLTGIAHDIRSPLSAINGFAELLQKTLDGTKADHARKILKATRYLNDMADSLSELARLESGTLDLDVEPVQVAPLVRDTIEALEHRARKAGIDLCVSVPEAAVEAMANAGALRRVVDNLAGNAVKYCDDGDRVTVRVYPAADVGYESGPDAALKRSTARRGAYAHPEPQSKGQPNGEAPSRNRPNREHPNREHPDAKEISDTETVPPGFGKLDDEQTNGQVDPEGAVDDDSEGAVDDTETRSTGHTGLDGEAVCIEVADTGPGIDEDFLDIMYEPFSQKTRDADGSGLGLAVTKQLVEAMGGRIRAASEEGRGTTFSVFLRAAKSD